MPVTDLEGRVRNELVENSALEEAPSGENGEQDNGDREDDDSYSGEEGTSDNYDADQRADYASDDDTPDYLLNQSTDESGVGTFQMGNADSFYDRLIGQLGEYDLNDKKRDIITYLIGSLDSDGLLRKDLNAISDELAIYHQTDADVTEIEDALHILQSFEPCGIAARSLQECLLIQLRDESCHLKGKDLDIKIIENSFEDFTHKRLDKLMERYHLDEEEVRQVYGELSRLNPRPGSGLGDSTGQNMQQVIPDFIVTEDNGGGFDIRLNSGDVPHLRVSRSFCELLEEYAKNKKNMNREQKSAYIYSRQKVDAAQNFINAIKQRQDTLMKTMRTIVALQQPFFHEGDETLLHPMILKDVAARTGLDISTVSRVSNSKYVQTDFGVYPLKFFFNDTFVTKEGEELSKVKIKTTLKELINGEDKASPLSDEVLAAKLKEKGYAVARRTVAKYREQLGIPVARLRR